MPISIRLASWTSDRDELLSVRYAVFVDEQGIDPTFEIDENDGAADHALALEDSSGEAIGTARLLPDGHIGRVAVLQSHRRAGVGRRLIELLLQIALQKEMSQVFLHAQMTSLLFYERLGFEAHGPVFLEAGLEHREMTKELLASPT